MYLEGLPFSRNTEFSFPRISDHLSLQVPLPSSPFCQSTTDIRCYLPFFLIVFRNFSTYLYILWTSMGSLLEWELWDWIVGLLNINRQWISDHPNYRNTIPSHVTIISFLLCFFGKKGSVIMISRTLICDCTISIFEQWTLLLNTLNKDSSVFSIGLSRSQDLWYDMKSLDLF